MRADAQENRRELLAAAARLVSEQGSEVSLRSVAASAGVGIGTLYRHFPSREDLLTGLLLDVSDSIDGAAALFHAGSGDVAERWREFTATLAALDVGSLLIPFRQEQPTIVSDPRVGAVRERILSTVSGVLEGARAADLVDADVTPLRFMVGVVLLSRSLTDGLTGELRGFDTWIVAVYLRGLRPDAGSAG